VLDRVRTWARDGACWRELGWLLFSCTFGWALAIFTVTLPLAVGWYLVYPLVWSLTSEGTFDINYGLFEIDTFAETFLHWGFAALATALWWWLTPPLVLARARVDATMLGARRVEQLERRVQTLTQTRAETVDASAAELRRIEHDLHDGVQARLVGLGMSLGMVQEMLRTTPSRHGRCSRRRAHRHHRGTALPRPSATSSAPIRELRAHPSASSEGRLLSRAGRTGSSRRLITARPAKNARIGSSMPWGLGAGAGRTGSTDWLQAILLAMRYLPEGV